MSKRKGGCSRRTVVKLQTNSLSGDRQTLRTPMAAEHRGWMKGDPERASVPRIFRQAFKDLAFAVEREGLAVPKADQKLADECREKYGRGYFGV